MASSIQTPPPAPPSPPRFRRSLGGPVVLIIVGIVFLLGTMGVLHWYMLGHLFAHYWPLLIIVWGIVKLIEHEQAKRAGTRSSGIGAGGIFLLIVLIVFGLMATQAARFNWYQLREQMDMDGNDFPFFGHTYSYTDELQQDFPAGASLHVVNDRGAVNLTASTDNQIHVTVHKRVNAESQENADKWNASTKPQITGSGNAFTLNANTQGAGDHWVAADLDVAIPRKASVVVSTRHGDVSVLGRDGDVDITSRHGDVSVTDINGKVSLNLDHSSARVSQVSTDVSVEGHANDVSLEDVKGSVHLDGDFTESVKLSKIAKGGTFKTTRTSMAFSKLEGDLDLDSGDLEANDITGPVRLETRAKDIQLQGVSGDLRLKDENGAVAIHVTKLGSMQVENRQGDIEIYLPEKAAFQLDARAQNGEIYSDFSGVKSNESNDQAVATGTVGAGGSTIVLNNEHGTIKILKGTSLTTPRASGTPTAVPEPTEN